MRFAVIMAIVFTASASVAQPDWVVDGRIYLSASPDELVSTVEVDEHGLFEFYIVVEPAVPDGQVGAQISALEGHLDASSGIAILQISWPDRAIDVAAHMPEPDAANFIVGLGVCHEGERLALGRVSAMVLSDGPDLEIGLGAIPVGSANPSSFAGEGPGWISCHESNQLRMFEPVAEGRTLAVASQSVPTDQRSFGAVKSLYQD